MKSIPNAATCVRFALAVWVSGCLSVFDQAFSQSTSPANKGTPTPQVLDSQTDKTAENDKVVNGEVDNEVQIELEVEAEENSPFVPGLLLQHADDVFVTRKIVFAAADLKDGKLPTIAGPLVWTGYLESEGTGIYKIAANVTGQLRVELDDRIVLEAASETMQWVSSQPIELPYGHHPIRVTFSMPAKADSDPNVTLFWSGPRFRFEPIPPANLWHDANSSPRLNLAKGAQLTRALRCEACHTFASARSHPLASPNLATATQHLRPSWLSRFLMVDAPVATNNPPTDPLHSLHAVFTPTEAAAVVSWLHSKAPPAATGTQVPEQQFNVRDSNAEPGNSNDDTGDSDSGQELMFSIGCLACHSWNGLGNSGLFGGGDLTDVQHKRTPEFFARWLANPAVVNSDHRMPVFDLSEKEIADLSAFLRRGIAARDNLANEDNSGVSHPIDLQTESQTPAEIARKNPDPTLGEHLFHSRNCSACHAVGNTSIIPPVRKTRLDRDSDWERSCLTSKLPDRPNYQIESTDVPLAIQLTSKSESTLRQVVNGPASLHENNCLDCHARGDSPGMAPVIQQIADQLPQFVNRLPAMQPPALNSVGDKLLDEVLRRSISRNEPPRRHWLAVRMPRFPLNPTDVHALARHFIQHDRVPDVAAQDDRGNEAEDTATDDADAIAADRLVTSEGFGCVSCHAIGNLRPPASTPLGQLAPSLSAPKTRIRKTWFDRWVRNPSRITPRMEMPSVQIPIPGLMNNDLDRQLNALWRVLNVPRFTPPDPAPTRILAQAGHKYGRALVLTDIFRFNNKKLIKPLLIGLPNRHNVLFDLQVGRLAGQWQGDTAQQRTQGKTWFWESPIIEVSESTAVPEIVLLRGDHVVQPIRIGQGFCELDAWSHIENGVQFDYRMRFPSGTAGSPNLVRVSQRVVANDDGWHRTILLSNVPTSEKIGIYTDYGAPRHEHHRIDNLVVATTNPQGEARLELQYRGLPESRSTAFDTRATNLPEAAEAAALDIAEGFHATRLPLRNDVMPISLGWNPQGELIVGSLKGRVWLATDRDGDNLEETLIPISDDLASPYGIHASTEYVDVVTKFGIVRLSHFDESGLAKRHELIADGWGHTDDYHDWVVGLPRDSNGNYFISIPCQQDERSDAAARFRGAVLRLSPRTPDTQNPRRFELTPISMGHRFPMGIARNQWGQIFVTDNQGNYNPYNELNHVTPGARFGFINRIDRRDGFNPPLTPPAINIPHPWTRSVNGICFLETPTALREQAGPLYGPYEGHLIGCEYDTRRLIRMSIDNVNGWVQGAAYPFAEATSDTSKGLQGPINCGIAPDGDIYIANIRDSGWGGANNTGSIVRMNPNPNSLPTGIAEVSAIRGGFQITFTRPVNRKQGANPDNYNIVSATRKSTPAYGGDDIHRRGEAIQQISLAPDAQSVTIQLEDLREGYVYEFRLKNLVSASETFYPAEAYYSLTRIRQ